VRERQAGQTKFNFRSLCSLAINAITSFSVKPLRLVGVLGVVLALFSFGFGIEVMWEKYMLQNTIPGWATIVVCVCFFSGVQIFCLGVMGEYLGQIYKEVKARPRYIKDVELI
jgi:protein-S-isoprenylcysteine O-methyltransferase Ste14